MKFIFLDKKIKNKKASEHAQHMCVRVQRLLVYKEDEMNDFVKNVLEEDG